MASNKDKELFDLKNEFNDKVMREFGIGVAEDNNDYIYWMDTESIIMLKDKYIKYCEEQYTLLGHDEIELDFLANPRLMMTLVYIYLKKRISNEIVSVSQDTIKGSDKGHFILSYIKDGQIAQMQSDPFINDSVRIFNFVCKINCTEHLYDFKKYDIPLKSTN